MGGRVIAILGGTFNPIHNGHLRLAKAAAATLRADRVLLIPDSTPPHKSGAALAPAADRLAMCELAAAGDPLLQVSDMEIRRGGRSYTIDTLTELHQANPRDELWFACGTDMFVTLPRWYRYREILPLAGFCVYRRAGDAAADVDAIADAVARSGGRVKFCDALTIDVSSTEIRGRIKEGRDISGLVPDSVREYIAVHELYGE